MHTNPEYKPASDTDRAVVPAVVNAVARLVAKATRSFVGTKIGKWFLALSLLGPVMFLPTVYEVWTAPNIDVFKTPTWPLLVVVNIAIFISVCHEGDWRSRLSVFTWIILIVLICVAAVVR